MIRQTIFWYIGFSALMNSAIALHSTVYVLYLLSKGLNLFEVSLVNVAFYVTLTLFEIPTGAYADIFGRKSSFVLSAIIQSLGCLIYFVAGSLPGFILAEVVLAIGVTLMSGAFDAWAVDRLKHFGHNGDMVKVFSRKAKWQQVVSIAAGLIGAYIGAYHLGLPWLVSSVLLMVTAVLAYVVLKEEYFSLTAQGLRHGLSFMKQNAWLSIQFAFKLKPVRFLLSLGLVQYFSVMAYNMQWQPWFENLFNDRSLLGWLWVGMSLSVLAGNYMSSRLASALGGNEKALVACQIAIAVPAIFTVFFPVLGISLAAFLLHELPRGTFRPLSDTFLHTHIPSLQRATIGSVQSMAHHVGGAVGLLVSGWVANRFGIPAAWYVSSLVLIIGSVAVYRKFYSMRPTA